MIQLAPAPEMEAASEPQLPQLVPDEPDGPLWKLDYADEWRTRFPPPPDFTGAEEGRYGDEDYSRALTAEELVLADGMEDLDYETAIADRRAAEMEERDRWFAEWRRELTAAGRVEAGEDGDGGAGRPEQPIDEREALLVLHALDGEQVGLERLGSGEAAEPAGMAEPWPWPGTPKPVTGCASRASIIRCPAARC